MVDGSAQKRVWRHNDRANIENHIKEIKCGFGMEKLPTGDFGGSALYFGTGILSYNLFIAQKYLAMPEDWRTKSIRWLLVEVAGKLIQHGRTLTQKIAASLEKYRLYLEMRRNACSFAGVKKFRERKTKTRNGSMHRCVQNEGS